MPRWCGVSGRLPPSGHARRRSTGWSAGIATPCSAAAPNGCGPMPTRRSPMPMTLLSSPTWRWVIPRSWRARTGCGTGWLASRRTAISRPGCPPGSTPSTGGRCGPASPPARRTGRTCGVTRRGRSRCGAGSSRSWPRCPNPGGRCTTCSCAGRWTAAAPRRSLAPTPPRPSGCAGRTARRSCAPSRSPRWRPRRLILTRSVAGPAGAGNCGSCWPMACATAACQGVSGGTAWCCPLTCGWA